MTPTRLDLELARLRRRFDHLAGQYVEVEPNSRKGRRLEEQMAKIAEKIDAIDEEHARIRRYEEARP